MGDFIINDKAEQAFVNILQPLVMAAGLNPQIVVPGKSYDLKSVPLVICDSSGDGDEDPKNSGNFWLNVQVQVKTPAFLIEDGQQVDPKDQNELLVRTVFQALQVDDLPAQLASAVDNFFVFPNGFIVSAPTRGQDESGLWIDSMAFRIYCCGSDLL